MSNTLLISYSRSREIPFTSESIKDSVHHPKKTKTFSRKSIKSLLFIEVDADDAYVVLTAETDMGEKYYLLHKDSKYLIDDLLECIDDNADSVKSDRFIERLFATAIVVFAFVSFLGIIYRFVF